MEILTSPIQQFLVDAFSKNIEKVGYSDLLLVESLTIDGKSSDGKRQFISFDELKLFKNLKYLELRNMVISNYMIDILKEITYLQNIVFMNCTFRKSIVTLNVLQSVNLIRVESCKNFRLDYINNININYLTIAGSYIKTLLPLRGSHINVLDISREDFGDLINLDELDLQKIVIGHDAYLKYKDFFMKSKIQVIVMANDGFYIEKFAY